MNPGEELKSIFDRQKRRSVALRASTCEQRLERINRLSSAVRASEDQLLMALHEDLKKPAAEVELTELLPVYQEARFIRHHLHRWMRPQRVSSTLATFGTRAWVQYQPRGAGLILSTWNYPINLTLIPILDAFAAGCPVVVKPSELAPSTSACLRQIINTNFNPEDAVIVEGDAAIAQNLLTLPFDHFFFTGGQRVGQKIQEAAASHLATVTLELGGKSPAIIDHTADLHSAAKTIIWAKFTNAGQTCLAPDHLYVHHEIKRAFNEALIEEICRVWGTSPQRRKSNPDYCRIVSSGHWHRLMNLMKEALDAGATLDFGGQGDRQTKYLEPTLLSQVPSTTALMREEIFGPILPVLAFSDLDQLIVDLNAAPSPLTLYVFSRDRRFRERLIHSTASGSVVLNHTLLQFPHERLPFGGVGPSGQGSYHGFHGFREFSHARAIVQNHASVAHLLFPPYTPGRQRVIRLLTRLLS